MKKEKRVEELEELYEKVKKSKDYGLAVHILDLLRVEEQKMPKIVKSS